MYTLKFNVRPVAHIIVFGRLCPSILKSRGIETLFNIMKGDTPDKVHYRGVSPKKVKYDDWFMETGRGT